VQLFYTHDDFAPKFISYLAIALGVGADQPELLARMVIQRMVDRDLDYVLLAQYLANESVGERFTLELLRFFLDATKDSSRHFKLIGREVTREEALQLFAVLVDTGVADLDTSILEGRPSRRLIRAINLLVSHTLDQRFSVPHRIRELWFRILANRIKRAVKNPERYQPWLQVMVGMLSTKLVFTAQALNGSNHDNKSIVRKDYSYTYWDEFFKKCRNYGLGTQHERYLNNINDNAPRYRDQVSKIVNK
jgi:hypothetical protein